MSEFSTRELSIDGSDPASFAGPGGNRKQVNFPLDLPRHLLTAVNTRCLDVSDSLLVAAEVHFIVEDCVVKVIGQFRAAAR